MLIMCPECKKQFSETADSCPKCGFRLDEATRQSLRAKAIRTKRGYLAVVAIFLLLFGGPCTIAPFAKHEGHTIRPSAEAQQRAYGKLISGQRLTDVDVDDLAAREIHISASEARQGAWTVFWLGVFLFVLPGSCIFVYLYATRSEISRQSQQQADGLLRSSAGSHS